MSQALNNLLTLLNPKNRRRAISRTERRFRLTPFLAAVVGQALYAAKETVPADRLVHSFHSYFYARRQR